MAKTRLGIITMRDFFCYDLYSTIKKSISKNNLDITVERICIEDVEISYENSSISLKTKEFDLLKDFDVFLFRCDLQKNLQKTYFIAKTLKNSGKLLVNETYSDYTTFSDKVSVLNVLRELELAHPNTLYTCSHELLLKKSEELGFPFILKDPYGWQGTGVYLIKTKQELENALKNMPKHGFILQEYLPIDHDVRIIVIGHKALGAMKRINPKDDFRSNLSIGGTAEQIPLTKELRDISEKIATHIKSAMLGIDIFIHDNKLLVNEIETCPGFKGFAKCTETKPVLHLLNYIYNEHALKKT